LEKSLLIDWGKFSWERSGVARFVNSFAIPGNFSLDFVNL